ncbi:hypothetical protein [Arthrobacter pascens]|uniref:hypothetical protein n=1 Tax=Arthrobacter pascens TaxID=1677 RepID=UPI0027D81822|nr:hypothetical protein [Arthrobacter pascens]
MAASTFPGATAISAVSIYDWPARDGAAGGTPHLHTASTEAYIVLEGTGRLETLDSRGFASTDLRGCRRRRSGCGGSRPPSS